MEMMLYCADDEKSLLHFKLRVLDLVEVFVQKEPSNPLVLVSQQLSLPDLHSPLLPSCTTHALTKHSPLFPPHALT